MRRFAFAVSLSVLTSAAFAAPAETAANVAAPVAEVADAAPVAAMQPVADTQRNCIRDTGTRIARRDKDGCLNVPGRSYSQQDIRSTGATNVADALQHLDPAISRR